MRRHLIFLLSGLAAASPLLAAAVPHQDPDEKAVDEYRLTEDMLRKMQRITRAVRDAVRNDPAAKPLVAIDDELDALNAKRRNGRLPEPDQKRVQDLADERIRLLSPVLQAAAGKANTLAERETQIRSTPHLPRALDAEGVTAREYEIFWRALVSAAFLHGARRAGLPLEDLGVKSTTVRDNVKFFEDHERQIARMDQDYTRVSGILHWLAAQPAHRDR